ncbi:MAG TPA: response regulator [Chloroflexota bacterium]|nr:response regulator [Chloroflexota bacterium]
MTSEASASPAQKCILVVEDSDEIRELLGFVLESEGYQVVALEDGRDVVETAREQQPALITLDLALPGKDGWAIVRELQDEEQTRDIPILVISAYTRELDAPLRRRVARVISKPFYINQVVSEVEEILTSGGGRQAI